STLLAGLPHRRSCLRRGVSAQPTGGRPGACPPSLCAPSSPRRAGPLPSLWPPCPSLLCSRPKGAHPLRPCPPFPVAPDITRACGLVAMALLGTVPGKYCSFPSTLSAALCPPTLKFCAHADCSREGHGCWSSLSVVSFITANVSVEGESP